MRKDIRDHSVESWTSSLGSLDILQGTCSNAPSSYEWALLANLAFALQYMLISGHLVDQ